MGYFPKTIPYLYIDTETHVWETDTPNRYSLSFIPLVPLVPQGEGFGASDPKKAEDGKRRRQQYPLSLVPRLPSCVSPVDPVGKRQDKEKKRKTFPPFSTKD